MSNRFVIVGNARTGTSMLRTSISDHPDCICFPEILIYKDHDRIKSHKRVFGNDHYFDKHGSRTIEEYLDENLNGFDKPTGFKILSYDIVDWDMWNYFNDNNYKVILNVRNYIAGYVSQLQATKTGQHNIYCSSENIVKAEPVTVDMEDFYIHLEFRMECDIKALQKFKNIHVVRYKDLLFDYQNTMNDVFKFLNVEPKKVKPKTIKLNNDSFKDRIENFNSFFKTLEARYHYLTDDLV